ncbi:MAG: MFS transporter [Dehalococcoidia bacterium]
MSEGRPVSRLFPFYYGWVIVVVGSLVWILSIGHYYTFGVYFKPVAGEFGWSRAATSMASSLVILTSGAMATVMGILTDRYGPRIVVSLCGVVLGGGYLLLSRMGVLDAVGSLGQFYLFYFVVGLGMSGTSAPLTATVSRWFVARRGQAVGLMTLGGGFGQFLMPLLASYLILGYGWRTAYAVQGLLIVVALGLLAQFLRRDPEAVGLSAGAAPSTGSQAGLPPRGFSLREAARTQAFWRVFAVTSFALFGQVMLMMHLVPHATDLGVSREVAPRFIALIGLSNMVGKLVMGPISDRIGRKATLSIVFFMAGTMMLWLLVTREEWMFYVFAALFGFAYGAWIPMFPAIMGDLFGMASLGALVGANHLAVSVGAAIGSFLGGYIFDVTGSYFWAFLLAGTMFYLAGALVLTVKQPIKGAHA